MTEHCNGQKLVAIGGSSGMGRQTAADVVGAGGSAAIIGQDDGKVDDTVETLAKDGQACGITADLADRMQVARVRQQLAASTPTRPCGVLAGQGRPARPDPQPGDRAGAHQIRVNAVAPAFVDTLTYERFIPKDKVQQTLHGFDALQLLGRVGTARDMANTITFLLSPATSWVSASAVPNDPGGPDGSGVGRRDASCGVARDPGVRPARTGGVLR
jgi:NAD(P)-dependent dehydrogenase (short-subunit alcohol dehydrogenase family)